MKKNKTKEKKKKLSFKRTVSNNLFALRAIWVGSPIYIAVYLGSSFIYGAMDFLSEGYLLRKIVNGVGNGDTSGIITYVAILGTINFVVYLCFSWFWNVVSPVKHKLIAAHIEKMLFKKAARVDLSCYENPSFYDKYVRAMDEAYDRILKVMYTLDDLIMRFIALFANSLLLFIIDPVLILFGLFPLILGIFKRLENVANHEFELEKKPINRRHNYVRRTFYLGEYSKEIRMGGMYRNILRDLEDTFTDFKKVLKKYGPKKSVYMYVQRVGLEVITVLGATLYSVWSAMCIGEANGGMSVGDCIVVLGSIGTISYCLNNLVQNFAEFGEHALYLDDVRYFLDYKEEVEEGSEDAPDGGELTMESVSFKYDGSDEYVLRDISFTLKKGERIALVGTNGSGKTTLVKLIMRLYDPTEGRVTVDGKDVKTIKKEDYRAMFSSVFQDFKVFSLTVRENVLLRPIREGDDAAVRLALENSGIYSKVSGFEKGIDTVLTREFDDKGENLSGGETQKLSLAGVFASDSPFVILDEPTSALDPIAEYTMFENMMKATEGRSVIFISHRLSSAVLADRVLLMENGRITECGTHAELMAMKGRYAEMFHRQAENYLGGEAYDG